MNLVETKFANIRKIPYARQSISNQDITSVVEALSSEWLTQGPAIGRFEDALKEYCGGAYSVAVSSATAALHIACMAIDLGPGDWLWTSPNTFVASANCARYCGASVDFVDIDHETFNISVSALSEKLEAAEKTGCLPKALIPVHFGGQSCEMERIQQLSQKYGFIVIEDASHAIGGRYQNKPIGCCKYSDMAVLSFHPVKIITTGEGGAILTNKQNLYEKLTRLRTHGITRDPALMPTAPIGPWEYQQIDLGYNYRITDIQAALGASQLKRIDQFVLKRHELAAAYTSELGSVPLLRLQKPHADAFSAYHLFVINVEKSAGLSRLELFQKMREAGIEVNVHYAPVHLQPYYRSFGFAPGDFPNAEKYYSQAITLPLYYDLSPDDQAYVIQTLKELLV